MLPVPWWLPALILGAARLLWPRQPFIAVLAYHGVCLAGLKGPFAWGRVTMREGLLLAVAFAALPLLLLVPPLPYFPKVQVHALLAGWPGGLWSWAAYSFVFNVLIEEAFWRGTVLRRHGWPAWGHGLAFGLHHSVAAAISLPWMWVLPAGLVTAAAGAFWSSIARDRSGIGLAALSHLWIDLGIVLFVFNQVSP